MACYGRKIARDYGRSATTAVAHLPEITREIARDIHEQYDAWQQAVVVVPPPVPPPSPPPLPPPAEARQTVEASGSDGGSDGSGLRRGARPMPAWVIPLPIKHVAALEAEESLASRIALRR